MCVCTCIYISIYLSLYLSIYPNKYEIEHFHNGLETTFVSQMAFVRCSVKVRNQDMDY